MNGLHIVQVNLRKLSARYDEMEEIDLKVERISNREKNVIPQMVLELTI